MKTAISGTGSRSVREFSLTMLMDDDLKLGLEFGGMKLDGGLAKIGINQATMAARQRIGQA